MLRKHASWQSCEEEATRRKIDKAIAARSSKERAAAKRRERNAAIDNIVLTRLGLKPTPSP
jgi:hypothetical protein